MKQIIVAISLLAFAATGFAKENFKVASKVDSVKTSGFYKVQLHPGVVSFAAAGYSDVRLVNSRGEEIPFIFEEEKPNSSSIGLKEYPLLENKYLEKEKLSRVIVHNVGKSVISNLALVIRNSNIQKEITLKGSDDRKNWFIIWKGYPQDMGSFNETATTFLFDFPKSDYEYFEISTKDTLQDPIQIIRVGYYDSRIIEGMYSEIGAKLMSQKDSSDKKSYISIVFERPNEFNKLELVVTGTELFRRDVLMGQWVERNNKTLFKTLGSFELISDKPAVWPTEKLKVKELVLIIENLDNKPLKVEAIKFYQLNKYLVAKLEKGETYFIKSGNDGLAAPEYDLKYFSQIIPENLPTLHTTLLDISGEEKTSVSRSFFTKTILWVVISGVILLLGFFSIRLMKEMK